MLLPQVVVFSLYSPNIALVFVGMLLVYPQYSPTSIRIYLYVLDLSIVFSQYSPSIILVCPLVFP